MVNFNFKFDSSYTAGLSGTALTQANAFMTQLKTGMEMAGRVWSSYLTDNVTINIGVGVMRSSTLTQEQRDKKVIGGALPAVMYSTNFNWNDPINKPPQTTYSSFRNALRADAKSADDILVAGNPLNPNNNPGLLENSSVFRTWFDQFNEQNQNVGRMVTSEQMVMTRANGKALGLLKPTDTGYNDLDGYILISDLSGYNAVVNGITTPITWANTNTDFGGSYTNVSSGPVGTRLDMMSVLMHEMGHVLGYVSGVDDAGALTSRFTSNNGSESYLNTINHRVKQANPLDFFRMSDVSRAQSTGNQYVNDMSVGSIGGAKYFTLDKGVTKLAEYSTGAFSDGTNSGGDGQQASHWRNSTTNIGGTNYRVGLMGPSLTLGAKPWLGHLDLRAMDVIGWDLSSLASGVVSSTNTGVRMGTSSSVTNLSTLLSQAQAASMNTSLTQSEVQNMIRKSYIYNDGNGNDPFWNDGSGNDPFWNDGSGNDPFWQKITNLFWARGAFQELDLSGLASSAETSMTQNAPTQANLSLPNLNEILTSKSFWKGNFDLKRSPAIVINIKRLSETSEAIVKAAIAVPYPEIITDRDNRQRRSPRQDNFFTSSKKSAPKKSKPAILREEVSLKVAQLEIKL